MKLSSLVSQLKDFLTENGDCEISIEGDKQIYSLIIDEVDETEYPLKISLSSDKSDIDKLKYIFELN